MFLYSLLYKKSKGILHMTKFTRLTAMLIIAVLLTISFAACSDQPTELTDDTTTAPAVVDVTEAPEDTAEKLEIPEGVDCGGATMGVLYWSDVENLEFFIEDSDAELDAIQSNIKKRNIALEDEMKVKLDFIGQKGNAGNLKSFVSYIGTGISSGDHAFDIIAGYSQTVANAALNHYCYDISKAEYINLEKPWWASLLTEEATINDKLYFVSGDISTNLLYMMYTFFFNKDLLAERTELRSPYDMINSNEWTIDNMIAMTTDYYRDLDADQTKSSGDRYGLVLPELSIDALFYSADLRTADRDAAGLMIASDTYFSEKAQSLLDKLMKLCYDDNDGYWKGGASIFAEGRSLFYIDRAVASIKSFADSDVDYGVAPSPKWSSDQEEYYTCAGNPFTLYAIVSDSQVPDLASAVLEAWAYYGYEYTTPAIFEVTMKIRFAKDSETAKMYDMIRNGITFDLGRIYGITLGDMTQTLYRNAMTNRTTWAARKSAYTRQLTTLMQKVNAAYSDD